MWKIAFSYEKKRYFAKKPLSSFCHTLAHLKKMSEIEWSTLAAKLSLCGNLSHFYR